MGLPELTFSLQKAAESAAARIQNGAVALILRDSKANGVHTVRREEDIPSTLGVNNRAYIKRAMTGYINRPSVVYVSVVGTEGTIADGFAALGAYSYDYIAGPPDISAEDASALAALVKAARKQRYVGKAVVPDTAADSEGVVNFSASGIKAGTDTFAGAAYCSRVAGVLAGTPADCSATYAALSELTAVDAVADADAAVNAGKLILVDDGRRIKLGRAVTSKTTLASDEPALLKKIKLVAAVDLIRYFAISTVEDDYLGKCANTYDNKCILLTSFTDYFTTLEAQGILAEGSSGAELDASAIRTWLLENTSDTAEQTRIAALSDDELRREDTGSHVFLLLSGRLVDAMEDFHITLEAQ